MDPGDKRRDDSGELTASAGCHSHHRHAGLLGFLLGLLHFPLIFGVPLVPGDLVQAEQSVKDVADDDDGHWVLRRIEVGQGQSRMVESMLERAGLAHVDTIRDLAGIPRVVTGRAR